METQDASSRNFSCDSCNFQTDRLSKFMRHKRTKKHDLQTLNVKRFRGSRDLDDAAGYDYEDEIFSDNFLSGRPFQEEFGNGLQEEEPKTDCHQPDLYFGGDTGSDSEESPGESAFIHDLTEDSLFDCGEFSEDDMDDYDTIRSSDTTKMYYPFPNKTVFLLCTLMYSSTHNVSGKTMQYILYILKELGAANVPSFKTLKNFRFMDWESMVKQSSDERDETFYHIKLSSWLSLSLAHPTTSECLIRYPRDNQLGISEQADGLSWNNHIQSHWTSYNGTHYRMGQFINSGDIYGRIEHFYEKVYYQGEKRMMTHISVFKLMEIYGKQTLVWTPSITSEVPLSECTSFYFPPQDIIYKQTSNGQISPLTQAEKCKMQLTASVQPSVSIPINIFLDDTSANKSRRWSPIHVIQTQLSGLPLGMRDQHENVAFIAASEKVDILCMTNAILQEIEEMKRNPVLAFDVDTKGYITIIPAVGCLCLDGAMVSEVTHHLGPSANKNCAVCKVHVDDCLKLGSPKTCSWLTDVFKKGTEATSAKEKKIIQKENGVKFVEGSRSILKHLDVFRSVTFGSLHWFYLGIVRSTIKEIIDDLTTGQKKSMMTYLSFIDQSSFPHRLSQGSIKYFQSRQGKDFKVMVQLMPFIGYHVGVKRVYLNCLINLAKIGRLVEAKMLTTAQIDEFDGLIFNHVHFVKEAFPGQQRKQKTHSSLHVVSDIKKHGPMPAFKEDNFEKKHANIRLKLFNQNQKSRSRDTALAFAAEMCLQHIITGGYFNVGDKWLQAAGGVRQPGNKVRKFVLGKVTEINDENGKLKRRLVDETQIDQTALLQSFIDWKFEIHEGCLEESKFEAFGATVCSSGEKAVIGSFVLFKDPNSQDAVGKVLRLFRVVETTGRSTNWLEVQAFDIDVFNHESLNCPLIKTSSRTNIPAHCINQLLCVIHDCRNGNCTTSERNIIHNNHPFYFVNNFRLTHPFNLLCT